MKRKSLRLLFLTAFVMLGLPWMAVTFAPGDAGMAICFVLFFALNPLYAVFSGVVSGRKGQWYQPIATAALFLGGTWLFFDPGEPVFLRYAAAYLLLGVVSMMFSAWLHRRKKRSLP